MEQSTTFTVCFRAPFWVGIAERWDESGYQAAQVVFGAEPTDAQIWLWLDREWHKLHFSPPDTANHPVAGRKNPKRLQREARAATQSRGVSTRAQETLSRQRELEAQARQKQQTQKKQTAKEQKFLLKQRKKREKKSGR